jgi:hypothetical protein
MYRWMDMVSFIHSLEETKKKSTTVPCRPDEGVSSISPLAYPDPHSLFQERKNAKSRFYPALSLLGLVGRDRGLGLVGRVAAAAGVHALDGCWSRVSIHCLRSREGGGGGSKRTLALLNLGHRRNVVLGVLQSGLDANVSGESVAKGGWATHVAGVAVDNVALLKGAVLAGSVSLARHV